MTRSDFLASEAVDLAQLQQVAKRAGRGPQGERLGPPDARAAVAERSDIDPAVVCRANTQTPHPAPNPCATPSADVDRQYVRETSARRAPAAMRGPDALDPEPRPPGGPNVPEQLMNLIPRADRARLVAKVLCTPLKRHPEAGLGTSEAYGSFQVLHASPRTVGSCLFKYSLSSFQTRAAE
jgi:hypothetical protein